MKKILKKISVIIPDKLYMKIRYFLKFKKRLNLSNPKSFNEKLQWLKLHDRKDIYTTMVDKYEAKKYISSIIGEKYVLPTLGVYNTFDEINFDVLPNQFVIKCTHDSGGLVIVKDKKNIDIKAAKMKINKSMKVNYYYSTREWPYKNVKPRIIIEKFLKDNNTTNLRDYKFYCFSGEPKFLSVSEGMSDHSRAFLQYFDMNFNPAPFHRIDYKKFDNKPSKPINFDKMKKLAAKLSKDCPFVRVDFYEVNGKIYFGELTFYPSGGLTPFDSEEWNNKIGDWINLENLK